MHARGKGRGGVVPVEGLAESGRPAQRGSSPRVVGVVAGESVKGLETCWSASIRALRPMLDKLSDSELICWLQAGRKKRRLTQREAASKVGVGYSTWRAWERGAYRPGMKFWRRLWELLEASSD